MVFKPVKNFKCCVSKNKEMVIKLDTTIVLNTITLLQPLAVFNRANSKIYYLHKHVSLPRLKTKLHPKSK